jgi:hypothetical protein
MRGTGLTARRIAEALYPDRLVRPVASGNVLRAPTFKLEADRGSLLRTLHSLERRGLVAAGRSYIIAETIWFLTPAGKRSRQPLLPSPSHKGIAPMRVLADEIAAAGATVRTISRWGQKAAAGREPSALCPAPLQDSENV